MFVRFLIGLTTVALCTLPFPADARAGRGGGSLGSVPVRGYVTQRGTYVAPHVRTRPDGIRTNNLSYRDGGVIGLGAAGAAVTLRGVHKADVSRSGSNAVPGPIALANGEDAEREHGPWCPASQRVGSGVGFCLIN